jgi:hypothetical protein
MAMIYGEGSKAFVRLQEEILKKSTDLPLFAWETTTDDTLRGVLAQSPGDFRNCDSIVLSDDQFSFRDEITITNKGVRINTALQQTYADVYAMDLHCYRQHANGLEERVGIYLQRAEDIYIRYKPNETIQIAGLPRSHSKPIYLTTTADVDAIAAMVSDDRKRRICINFPVNGSQYRIDDICAVPSTYWHADQCYFAYYMLRQFRCFVRFRVTSRMSATNADRGTSSEESTQFILVCELHGSSSVRMSLYAESGLQSSPAPEGFINPFRQLDQYGPLGDPFSLSVLSPGERKDRKVKMIHTNPRHNYTVSIGLDASQRRPPFYIRVRIDPSDEYGTLNPRPLYARERQQVHRPIFAAPHPPQQTPQQITIGYPEGQVVDHEMDSLLAAERECDREDLAAFSAPTRPPLDPYDPYYRY